MYRALFLLIPLAVSSSACASMPDTCRNIASAGSGASEGASISHLQCSADRGDKSAMLELGKRYEEGAGVSSDPSRAATLYFKAATAIPTTTPIYSPPVRKGGSGRMMFLTNPNAGLGLAEAQYRLGRLYLEGRGVERNSERGNALIREAAKQGYAPAASHIQRKPDRQ